MSICRRLLRIESNDRCALARLTERGRKRSVTMIVSGTILGQMKTLDSTMVKRRSCYVSQRGGREVRRPGRGARPSLIDGETACNGLMRKLRPTLTTPLR